MYARDKSEETLKAMMESAEAHGLGDFIKGGFPSGLNIVNHTEVRPSEERSDELATQSQVAKITHTPTSVQPPNPPLPPQQLSSPILTLFAIRSAHIQTRTFNGYPRVLRHLVDALALLFSLPLCGLLMHTGRAVKRNRVRR